MDSLMTLRSLRGGSVSPSTPVQNRVPVYLMLPLDTVNTTTVQLSDEIPELLQGAADVGAEGVMVDVWYVECELYDSACYCDVVLQMSSC